MQETHMTLCVIQPHFPQSHLVPEIRKADQKWAKIGFFKFIKEFSHELLLNLFDNEKLYY